MADLYPALTQTRSSCSIITSGLSPLIHSNPFLHLINLNIATSPHWHCLKPIQCPATQILLWQIWLHTEQHLYPQLRCFDSGEAANHKQPREHSVHVFLYIKSIYEDCSECNSSYVSFKGTVYTKYENIHFFVLSYTKKDIWKNDSSEATFIIGKI